jgi:hypothetical protein
MMNGVSKTLLGMTVLLLPAVSMAQQGQTQSRPFSYTYAELAYDESDFDLGGGPDIDGDGFTLSGSFEINDDWHVYGSYAMADLDFGIDVDTLSIGAGYRYPLRDDVDIYGRVLYITSDVDFTGPGDGDEDGLGLQARIRYRVSDEFEVEGGIQHVDVFDSDTSLQAMARYHFNDDLSVGIGLTYAGETHTIGVNPRGWF